MEINSQYVSDPIINIPLVHSRVYMIGYTWYGAYRRSSFFQVKIISIKKYSSINIFIKKRKIYILYVNLNFIQ